MVRYKLVASDLDGTLLNSASEVSDENMSAIKELAKRGINFVPSTGRTIAEIPVAIKECPDIRYFIYANGAAVYDKVTGKRILTCLPNYTVQKILDIVNAYESHVTIRFDGCAYVDGNFQSDHDFEYYNVCEAHVHVVRNFAIYSDDFKKLSYSSDNVEVVSVFFHNYEDKLKCRETLMGLGGLRVVEVDTFNIEIVNENAGKDNALHSLADLIGIDIADAISIGDSNNDKSIVEAAGLGLAVSNATDELKSIADAVICSNDEHAAAYVLKNYF